MNETLAKERKETDEIRREAGARRQIREERNKLNEEMRKDIA
jgi:hypothetical protein